MLHRLHRALILALRDFLYLNPGGRRGYTPLELRYWPHRLIRCLMRGWRQSGKM